MTFQLSDRAKELIPKARIVKTEGLSEREEAMASIKAADDGGRYLTDDELAEFDQTSLTQAAQQLREGASEIVTAAREQVLVKYPGITAAGGALYPELRAEACWRDFWHFLRCVTYGLASGSVEFTSAEGLHYMQVLYEELQVPLPAMVTGLEALKVESLKQVSGEAEAIAPYFDHLIEKMRAFV